MKDIIKILIITIFLIILKLFHNYKNKRENFYDYYKNKIPKIIISTYHNKNIIPNKVYRNIKKYAPNYKHIIYDDNDIVMFLKKYYNPKILETFYKLNGAHKADLFRYCYLYKFGGIYLDIKTELIQNIDTIFNKKNTNLYTVFSMFPGTIYQGIIATVPNMPIFEDLIKFIVQIKKPVTHYFAFTYDFYRKLKIYCFHNLKRGYNNNNIYLFYEKCTRNPFDCKDGLDRYNKCCYVYDNNLKIIKTRYSDYPW